MGMVYARIVMGVVYARIVMGRVYARIAMGTRSAMPSPWSAMSDQGAARHRL